MNRIVLGRTLSTVKRRNISSASGNIHKRYYESRQTYSSGKYLIIEFSGGHTMQGIKGNMYGSWYPEISLFVVMIFCVLVEEAFSDIGMNSRRAVVHL